ncbi:unnamed protein product [Bursaphelenchus okinawaensis]|uniref:EGF-like domain-containing protein n=1 Tax=Bursaphelenchus okinawaensis TaxID=465554 RepID=A0A811LIZ7_9BILA|nr:unnamed protein product [Bursaphelenchus okinawaensis]CAG9124131.1 unnamed protein product [Bursaphelenchus okinawaensis]
MRFLLMFAMLFLMFSPVYSQFGYSVEAVCVSRRRCRGTGFELSDVSYTYNCQCDMNWCGKRCEHRCDCGRRRRRHANPPLQRENQYWDRDNLCENVSCENGLVIVNDVKPVCQL